MIIPTRFTGGTMGQDKLWTRSFIVLMGVNFCSALSFYLVSVKITEYSVQRYEVPPSVAALTFSFYVISALLTRLFFGGKIDTWGVKRSLGLGAAVNAAAMALFLVPLGFAPLLLVRVFHGFGFALLSGSAAAGAALIIPESRYGEGIGYFSMMQALATGVGPFVAIMACEVLGGYTLMFSISLAVALLALVGVVLVKIPQGRSARLGKKGARPKRGIGSLLQLSVVPLVSCLFLVYFCYSGILTFVTSYADYRGLSEAVSLYFVVYAAVILISRPPVGRRVDRKGENSTIYCCFASLAIAFAVLAFATNGPLLLASAALAGFGIGATQSIVQAVIARDTLKNEAGRANSTFFMSMDLGSGIGPPILGALIPLVGYSACYLLLSLVAATAALLYHLAHGRKCRRRSG